MKIANTYCCLFSAKSLCLFLVSLFIGFGFLSFEDEESVDRCVAEHFVNLNGKQVCETVYIFISLRVNSRGLVRDKYFCKTRFV